MTVERLMNGVGEYYEPEPNTGCWLWLKALDTGGYGQTSVGGRLRQAHRIFYEFCIGASIPSGFVAHHKCETRSCVNPNHLEPMGKPDHTAKLTKDEVREVRDQLLLGATQRELAMLFGVDPSTISHISTGECWKNG